jgi:hypothetical protein
MTIGSAQIRAVDPKPLVASKQAPDARAFSIPDTLPHEAASSNCSLGVLMRSFYANSQSSFFSSTTLGTSLYYHEHRGQLMAATMGSLVRRVRGWAAAEGGGDDRALLDRFIAERDEAAFDDLVRRHGGLVFGLCRRLLPGVHDAEDGC